MKSFRVLLGVFTTVALAACGGTEVGSKYVKSETVAKDKATVIQVTANEGSTLVGTKLDLPAGALKADTTITLEVGMSDLVAGGDVAGPVAKWGPDGTKFNSPVTMTLPFSLPAGKSANDLSISVKEADGTTFRVPHSGLTVDAAKKLVSFKVTGFTSFQPSTSAVCRTDADCSTGEACQNGLCTGLDAGSGGGAGGGTGGGSGGGSGGGNGGGGGIDAGRACATTLDCNPGEACVNATCVPSGAGGGGGTGGGVGGGGGAGGGTGGAGGGGSFCVTTNDCASGELCVNGSCQSGPDGGSGGGAGGGSATDGGSGGGAGGGSGNFCRSDLECATSEVCVNNACVGAPVDGGSGGGAGGGSGSDGGTGGGSGADGGTDGGTVPDGGTDGGSPSDGGIDGGSAPDGGASCTSSSQCAMPEVCYQSTCQAIDCSSRPCPGALTCVNNWCQ